VTPVRLDVTDGGTLRVAGRSGRIVPHGELGVGIDFAGYAKARGVDLGGGVDLVLSPAISLTSALAYHRGFFSGYDAADLSLAKLLVGVTWSR
jgi:hypothetical protein